MVTSGLPRAQWLSTMVASLDPSDEVALMTLLRVGHVLSWGSSHHAIRHIATPASSMTTTALALYCLLLEDADAQQRCMALLPEEASRLARSLNQDLAKGLTGG